MAFYFFVIFPQVAAVTSCDCHRMSFDDYVSNFTKLEMCMMTPVRDTLTRDDAWQAKHIWKVTVHDGSWQRQVNAGGCRNYLGVASSL